MDELSAYLGFSLTKGIGPHRFKLLKDYFGSASSAWNQSDDSLKEVGVSDKLIANINTVKSSFQPQNIFEDFARKQIKMITQSDPIYPKSLLSINDPPIVLYIRGNLENLGDRIIGVVGTRKPTVYGKKITEQFVRELCAQGFAIVSGLARGVDGIAHRTALTSNARTVAVLGCGVDIVYPPEHRTLYQEIVDSGGAVISEVVPGHTVHKGLFPARNRIISAISRGVLVTEGARNSGSLITGRNAAEQGKDVFAIPGPITSYLSQGPARLINEGARLVTSVSEILSELDVKEVNMQQSKRLENDSFSEEQKQIVTLLKENDLHFDELVRMSGISVSQIGVELTTLELSGIIRNLGEGKYSLI